MSLFCLKDVDDDVEVELSGVAVAMFFIEAHKRVSDWFVTDPLIELSRAVFGTELSTFSGSVVVVAVVDNARRGNNFHVFWFSLTDGEDRDV